jgi:2-dehydropantoate 2-reductase
MAMANAGSIAVVGAGAVGSLIGGLLARAGENVTLIARKAHVDAIHEKGLRIDGALGTLSVPVKAAIALDFRPDLVLLSVKTQDVESTCQSIKTFLKDSTVVTLQNGVSSDNILASFVSEDNIISGVVMLNAQFLEPGKITYARIGSLVIGEAFGRNGQRIREIQTLLSRAIITKISDNIRGTHWSKLLLNNLGNGLEAITGMTVGECMDHKKLRIIGILILREGYRVIRKAGIVLAPLPGVPVAMLKVISRSPLPLASMILRSSMGSLRTVSSTLQSLRRGRPTEIDYLNGEIVRLGRQLSVPTPCNSKVVEIVKRVEETSRFLAPDELAESFLCKS